MSRRYVRESSRHEGPVAASFEVLETGGSVFMEPLNEFAIASVVCILPQAKHGCVEADADDAHEFRGGVVRVYEDAADFGWGGRGGGWDCVWGISQRDVSFVKT